MSKLTEYNQKETPQERSLRFAKANEAIDRGFTRVRQLYSTMPDSLDKEKIKEILQRYD